MPVQQTSPSQQASPRQRIPWSRRADLRVAPLEFSGQRSWGIKDPVTLAYFELRDEEYFVLQQLDGRTTIDDVCERFQQRFQPRTLLRRELEQFVGQLVSQGLLVSDGAGYGRLLIAREQQSRARQQWSALANVLVVRFRGFDPDALLERMLVWCCWRCSTQYHSSEQHHLWVSCWCVPRTPRTLPLRR